MNECKNCKGKLKILERIEENEDECMIVCGECGLLHWVGTKKELESFKIPFFSELLIYIKIHCFEEEIDMELKKNS